MPKKGDYMALAVYHKDGSGRSVASLPIKEFRLAKLRKVAILDGDLRGQDLSYLDARGVIWTGTNFDGANLTQADLSRGDFRGCNFRGAVLLYARFREAVFDKNTVLHWRSHDLMSAVLRFCAKVEYELTGDMEAFIQQALYSAVPHTFREWCWPEYKQYLPKEGAAWMAQALRPWVESDPRRDEYVPTELLETLGYGR